MVPETGPISLGYVKEYLKLKNSVSLNSNEVRNLARKARTFLTFNINCYPFVAYLINKTKNRTFKFYYNGNKNYLAVDVGDVFELKIKTKKTDHTHNIVFNNKIIKTFSNNTENLVEHSVQFQITEGYNFIDLVESTETINHSFDFQPIITFDNLKRKRRIGEKCEFDFDYTVYKMPSDWMDSACMQVVAYVKNKFGNIKMINNELGLDFDMISFPCGDFDGKTWIAPLENIAYHHRPDMYAQLNTKNYSNLGHLYSTVLDQNNNIIVEAFENFDNFDDAIDLSGTNFFYEEFSNECKNCFYIYYNDMDNSKFIDHKFYGSFENFKKIIFEVTY